MFITGFADIAASPDGVAGQGMDTMFKPFGLAEFELKISAMTLDLTDSAVVV